MVLNYEWYKLNSYSYKKYVQAFNGKSINVFIYTQKTVMDNALNLRKHYDHANFDQNNL